MGDNQTETRLRGESKNGRYSDQQRIIYERLRDGRQGIEADNSAMTGRASWLIAASGVIFSASALLSGTFGSASPGLFVAFVVANVAAFIVMAFLASSVWIPADAKVVGTNDINHLYATYIDEDMDDALAKLMADESSVFEIELTRNGEIAARVKLMVLAVDAQAVVLTLAAITAAVS